MKRKILFFAAMLSAMLLMISTAYAAGDNRTPVKTIYLSVMYDTETPQVGKIYVGHYFDGADLKDISIDKEKKLMNIELSLAGSAYKWAPGDHNDVRVMRFKNAKNLEYQGYNTVENENDSNIMIYLTWGDSAFSYDWFWKADDDGIKYVNPVTKAPLMINDYLDSGADGARLYFDGGGNLYKTDKKSQWLKAGPYDIYCDKDGNLMKNTRTPDGYNVDKRGIWIQ